jgi:hypothetical protein
MMPRSVGSSVKKLTPGNNPNTATAMPSAISRTAEVLKPGPMSVMFPNRLIGSSSRMFCSSCKTLTDDYSQIFLKSWETALPPTWVLGSITPSPRYRMPGMASLFKRHARGSRWSLFDDLPLEFRWKAERWFAHFCERWRGNLPGWRRAILLGRARWLAQHPPTSQWGRSMLAKRGGYAVQNLYRWEGRTGAKHPSHKAAKISVRNRRWRKEKKELEQKREALGLPPMPRHKILPCW